MDAVKTRLSNTFTGKTEGNSEGGKFLEAHSKADIRLRIQSRVRVPGHEIGIWAGGDGEIKLSPSDEEDEGNEAEEKKSSEEELCGSGGVAVGGGGAAVVVAESGGSDGDCILILVLL